MKINSYDKTFFEFIEVNAKEDLSKLKLKYHGKSLPFDLDFALLQIECRRKYATNEKLPVKLKCGFPFNIGSRASLS